MSNAKQPTFIRALVSAIQEIVEDGEVSVEKVSSAPRYRVAVVAPKFGRMPHMRRQDLLWGIVDQVLSPEDQLKLTLILAFAPDELSFDEQSGADQVAAKAAK